MPKSTEMFYYVGRLDSDIRYRVSHGGSCNQVSHRCKLRIHSHFRASRKYCRTWQTLQNLWGVSVAFRWENHVEEKESPNAVILLFRSCRVERKELIASRNFSLGQAKRHTSVSERGLGNRVYIHSKAASSSRVGFNWGFIQESNEAVSPSPQICGGFMSVFLVYSTPIIPCSQRLIDSLAAPNLVLSQSSGTRQSAAVASNFVSSPKGKVAQLPSSRAFSSWHSFLMVTTCQARCMIRPFLLHIQLLKCATLFPVASNQCMK
eukprot:284814612_2